MFNEFISSLIVFLFFVYMHQNEISFRTTQSGMIAFRFSIRMKFQPRSGTKFHSGTSRKLKTSFSDWRKKTMWDRSRLNALGWAGRFYHVNAVRTYPASRSIFPIKQVDISYLGKTEATLFSCQLAGSGFTLERNSFRNESHSVII